MIQIIAKLNEYLVIYSIWIDDTISIIIEKFDSCESTKNI
jgi:hypothetical protein